MWAVAQSRRGPGLCSGAIHEIAASHEPVADTVLRCQLGQGDPEMPVVLLLILFTLTSQAEDKSYAKQIADFRQEHESGIRSDTGPLLLVSRFELPERETVVELRPGRRFGIVRRSGSTAIVHT
jgi:hypothetical protein